MTGDPRPAAPFVHRLRPTWGDCDPAKIVFTGRIPTFCLTAIEAFLEHHFGYGWFVQELDHDTGMPFVSLNMDFRAPVTPRHDLELAVWPARLGTTSVTFVVEGRQDGTLCFTGRFTEVYTRASTFEKQPIPAKARAILEPLVPV